MRRGVVALSPLHNPPKRCRPSSSPRCQRHSKQSSRSKDIKVFLTVFLVRTQFSVSGEYICEERRLLSHVVHRQFYPATLFYEFYYFYPRYPPFLTTLKVHMFDFCHGKLDPGFCTEPTRPPLNLITREMEWCSNLPFFLAREMRRVRNRCTSFSIAGSKQSTTHTLL